MEKGRATVEEGNSKTKEQRGQTTSPSAFSLEMVKRGADPDTPRFQLLS